MQLTIGRKPFSFAMYDIRMVLPLTTYAYEPVICWASVESSSAFISPRASTLIPLSVSKAYANEPSVLICCSWRKIFALASTDCSIRGAVGTNDSDSDFALGTLIANGCCGNDTVTADDDNFSTVVGLAVVVVATVVILVVVVVIGRARVVNGIVVTGFGLVITGRWFALRPKGFTPYGWLSLCSAKSMASGRAVVGTGANKSFGGADNSPLIVAEINVKRNTTKLTFLCWRKMP